MIYCTVIQKDKNLGLGRRCFDHQLILFTVLALQGGKMPMSARKTSAERHGNSRKFFCFRLSSEVSQKGFLPTVEVRATKFIKDTHIHPTNTPQTHHVFHFFTVLISLSLISFISYSNMTLSALPEDPVVSCFDDDIMDEVALFMDVAMVQTSDPVPSVGTNDNGVLKTPSLEPPLAADMPLPTPITSSASVISFASDISSPLSLSTYNHTSSADLSQQTEFSVPNPFAAIATSNTTEEQQANVVSPTTVTSAPPTPITVSSAPLIPTTSELPDISEASNSPAPTATTTTTTTTAAKPTLKRTVTITATVENPNAKKRRLSTVSQSSGSDEEATATDEIPIDKR